MQQLADIDTIIYLLARTIETALMCSDYNVLIETIAVVGNYSLLLPNLDREKVLLVVQKQCFFFPTISKRKFVEFSPNLPLTSRLAGEML